MAALNIAYAFSMALIAVVMSCTLSGCCLPFLCSEGGSCETSRGRLHTPSGAENVAIPLPDGSFLPAFVSTPPKKQVKMALIIIHGQYRDGAYYYFPYGLDATKRAGQTDTSVVVAPAFLDKTCTKAEWLNNKSEHGVAPMWPSTTQWYSGAAADEGGVSAFVAMDAIVPWLTSEYPSLERILYSGHSAGAQFGHRWSILSAEGSDGKSVGGLNLSAMWGGTSTFLYFDEVRPALSCRDEGSDNCSVFEIPTSDESCDGKYDHYQYGLGFLGERRRRSATNGSMLDTVSTYLATASGYKTKDDILNSVPKRFAHKDVRWAVGAHDTESCIGGTCSDRCEAMLQGSNRLQRNLNYYPYLQRTLLNGSYMPNYGIIDSGHDAALFYASDYFTAWAFQGMGPVPSRTHRQWSAFFPLFSSVLISFF